MTIPDGPPAVPEQRDPRRQRRSFVVLIASSMLAKVADWQLGIVIPLAVLVQSNSVALALVVISLRGVAYVAAPILGSIIDRFDKRTVFALAQLEQAACLALVALWPGNHVAVAVLLLLSGFGAVISSITGQFVLVPKLFDPGRREVATAKLASAIEASKIVGLLLGGLISATKGPIFAAWLVTLLYLAAGLVALDLQRMPTTAQPSRIWHDLGIGFRWLVRPEILWLVLTMATANIAVGELEAVLVTLFGDRHVNALVIAVTIAVGLFIGAIGNRVGPHIAPRWNARRRILLFQLMSFASLAIISISAVPAMVAGYICICFALGGSNVASIAYRQDTIPVDYAGRINSVIRMFITGAIPVSGFLYAWSSGLGHHWFWWPGLIIAAVSAALWGLHTYSRERLSAEPA